MSEQMWKSLGWNTENLKMIFLFDLLGKILYGPDYKKHANRTRRRTRRRR